MSKVIGNSKWHQGYILRLWENRGAIFQVGKNGRNSTFLGGQGWLRPVGFKVPLKNSNEI